MKRHLGLVVAAAVVVLALPSAASAQSGHFLTGGANAPRCVDIGLQVSCSGKVAGLGGTTFEITVEAQGIASVECINPGGNRAPGQDTAVTVAGTTDPLPATPTCPNPQWTPKIVDVRFTNATLSLFEDGALSDRVTVPVSS